MPGLAEPESLGASASHVGREVFGNGLEGIYEHHASTDQIGRIQVVPISGSGAPVQDLGYAYEDAYGNLSRYESVATGVAERYVYDALQRLDSATRTWADGRAPVTIDYAYDALGNLTRKDDLRWTTTMAPRTGAIRPRPARTR